ncbi:RidA family protein [Gluconobacter sphaericus]|uniref:RidA family protein n=1 Tax=Gluconobacter sphaericus TaxID=574987 RepID=UPI001924A9A0|nr:RidA family protein [Gluconobacter sphaericus]QQX90611.1 RidA family protein [Gluconobacter sphaericus]
MSKNADISRHLEEERLAGVVVHNGIAYLAGQVADDASLDTEGQTVDVLRQIDALLASLGTDKSRILSVQIFLTDIGEIGAMNRAWDAWLDPTNKPARATVEAKLAVPEWRVEMTAIAALK